MTHLLEQETTKSPTDDQEEAALAALDTAWEFLVHARMAATGNRLLQARSLVARVLAVLDWNYPASSTLLARHQNILLKAQTLLQLIDLNRKLLLQPREAGKRDAKGAEG